MMFKSGLIRSSNFVAYFNQIFFCEPDRLGGAQQHGGKLFLTVTVQRRYRRVFSGEKNVAFGVGGSPPPRKNQSNSAKWLNLVVGRVLFGPAFRFHQQDGLIKLRKGSNEPPASPYGLTPQPHFWFGV